MEGGRTWLDERAARMAGERTVAGFLAWQDPHYYRPFMQAEIARASPILGPISGTFSLSLFPFQFSLARG